MRPASETHTTVATFDKYLVMPVSAQVPEAAQASPITDEMVAWLTIDGTDIDYPVMQGTDNTCFLNTDPSGDYSVSGSIFLDSRCSPDFTDAFSMIYGHHMDYSRMFGALDSFLDPAYLREHATGTLLVGRHAERTCRLEVFAAMRVSAREKIVFDLGQDEIRQYLRENADILTADKEAPILGMATCADADSVTRIAVFCYLHEQS